MKAEALAQKKALKMQKLGLPPKPVMHQTLVKSHNSQIPMLPH